MEQTPLVSVVITTYNRPRYLRKAIQSVVDQTYEPIELIIVDDHSTLPAVDQLDSIDISDCFSTECIRHSTNRGANAARNTGVAHATGKYIAFLDDDDYWLPEKTERQVELLESTGEDTGVVYTGLCAVKEDNEVKRVLPTKINGDLTKALLCKNVIGTMSVVMVTRELAEKHPFDESFPAWADLEWYIRLSTDTNFRALSEPLVRYEFTSPGRLSDNLQHKAAGYNAFVTKFEDVARQYGWIFTRKMKAWAAFRLGAAAVQSGQYHTAREMLLAAVRLYPFERAFFLYLLVASGGKFTYQPARVLHKLFPYTLVR